MDAYVHEVLIRHQIAQADERAAQAYRLRGARPPRSGFGAIVVRLARRLSAPRIVRRLAWRRA